MEREWRIRITAGLITSLIMTIFIQPILNFLWDLILNASGILHQGYVDRIYRNAARAAGNPYSEPTFFFILLVFIFVAMFWLLDWLNPVTEELTLSGPNPQRFLSQRQKLRHILGGRVPIG